MAKEDIEKKALEGAFKEGLLSEDNLTTHKFVKERIGQLQEVRKSHYGKNIDSLWADADADYAPHRLNTKTNKVIATDEERGWRGAMVNLGTENWQSDVSQPNVFVKIQTALAVLVDQNPTAVFTPTLKKYQASTALIKQLYDRSWRTAKSLYQLKLFVFNLAKYGWAVARTYPLRLENEVKELVSYDPENPSKSQYEKKKVIEYNDVYRENLDPRNAWIDDMARPNNSFSVRDWAWRKVYDYEDAKQEFGKYPLWKYVPKTGGVTTETVSQKALPQEEKLKGRNLVEVYFYENRKRDVFYVSIAGVPVVIEPLPVADRKGNKKLSIWQNYWILRHSESVFGIGVYEAMRYDQGLLDRISNMTIDQITLAIYKMFFYQGTQNLQETGDIVIKPGVGKQVIDPKVTWLDVPGPDRSAFDLIAALKKRLDESSGITEPLVGEVTGKTAFEVAQAKESALKRLKTPFDNVLEALENEAYISVCNFQLLYSIPEVYEISDERLINDYLKEIQGDEDLYSRRMSTNEQGAETSVFQAKVYPEFPLNLGQDEQGNLIETEETQFFRIKPKLLDWEGIANVKAQSILSPSKQIEKALNVEFYNLFIPLLTTLAQERLLALQSGQSATIDELPHGRAAKDLAKLYDKDPRDVFPTSWLQEPKQENPEQPQEEPLFIDASQGAAQEPPAANQPQLGETGSQPQPNTANAISERPQSLVGRIVSRMTQPFRQ